MNHTLKPLSVATAALLGIALLGAGASTAQAADQAKLAGDPGPGPYVQGCVDCHTEDGAENIGALLAAMKHRNVDKQTETVPGDCVECHSEDGGFTPLSEFSHMLHFENPAENAFIQSYGGNCLHCHQLDADTGIITVKSGPRNW
jgi:mono/diheme cytochrome c family protein